MYGCMFCMLLSNFVNYVSNARHPRCVLYNSKQLGMLTLTVEHKYICYYTIEVYNNNDMFWPRMRAIIRFWLDLQLRLY